MTDRKIPEYPGRLPAGPNQVEPKIETVTEITVKKSITLEESQVEELLEEWGRKRLDLEPNATVTVYFNVSSQGQYLKSVTIETETTSREVL